MFYSTPDLSDLPMATSDAPPATLKDVFRDAWTHAGAGGELATRKRLEEEAVDAHNDRIFKATGQRLDNYMRAPPAVMPEVESFGGPVQDWHGQQIGDYQRRLGDLAAQFPQHADVIRPGFDPRKESGKAMAELQMRLARSIEGSAATLDTPFGPLNPAALAAGFVSMPTDPTQWPAMLVGGGPTGVGTRAVIMRGLEMAAANTGQAAANAPFTYAWRKSAGLEYTAADLRHELMGAAAFGFALEAGIRGGSRLVRRGIGQAPEVDPKTGAVTGWRRSDARSDPIRSLDDAARSGAAGDTLKKAADGDGEAMKKAANEVGVAETDPAVRGALAAYETERLFGPPPEVDAGEHLVRLADALKKSMDGEAPPPGDAIRTPSRAPHADLSDGRDLAPGAIAQVEGKPVAYRAVDVGKLSGDPERALLDPKAAGHIKSPVWDPIAAGKAVVFERKDGAMIVVDGHRRADLALRLKDTSPKPPELHAYVFREADGWTLDDARSHAAVKSLREQSKSPLDMARIMRERPDLIDATMPLSDHRMRQAVGLSRLSERAFAKVAAGEVRPPIAALVGDLVNDTTRHAALIDAMARADLRSIEQARLHLGQLLAEPAPADVHMTRLGLDSGIRDLAGERAKVLDAALKALKVDKRVFRILDKEAPLIESAGNVLERDANIARAEMADRLMGLVEALAQSPRSVVSDLLQAAAMEVKAGVRPKTAAAAFARQVADIMERDGVKSLLKRSERDAAPWVRIDDPFGTEAKGQTDALSAAHPEIAHELSSETIDWLADAWRYVREVRNEKRPQGLVDWLRQTGGIADPNGDVRQILGRPKDRPGLISKRGSSLDDAALRAWEEGFIGDGVHEGAERPTVNDLLDAIDADLRGDHVVRAADRDRLENFAVARQMEDELGRYGVDAAESEAALRQALGQPDAGAEARAGAGRAGAAEVPAGQARGGAAAKDALDDLPSPPWDLSLGSEAKAARAAETALKIGRTVAVRQEVGDAVHALIRPLLDVLPDGVRFATLERLAPLRGADGADTVAEFRLSDNSRRFVEGKRSDFIGASAGYINADRLIVLNRLSDPSGFEAFLTGKVWHEVVHFAARNDLVVGSVWKRLLDRGNELGVLDVDHSTLLRRFKNPDWRDYQDGVQRELYHEYYKGAADLQERMDQETVAHLVELDVHGELLPEERAPVADILDALYTGRLKTGGRVAAAAPEKSAAPLAAIVGHLSKTADIDALDKAQRLELAGAEPLQIRLETGWERAADGQWRAEISDRGAKLKMRAEKIAKGQFETKEISGRLPDLLDHPLLFEAYPFLERYTARLTHQAGSASGRVDPALRHITVTAASETAAVAKILHEVQHAIQRHEKWAEGGNPGTAAALTRKIIDRIDGDAARLLEQIAALEGGRSGLARALLGPPKEVAQMWHQVESLRASRERLTSEGAPGLLWRLMGEVEARNVEARARMTRDDRLSTMLRDTEDVPRGDQVRVKNVDGAQHSGSWEDAHWRSLAERAHVTDAASAVVGSSRRTMAMVARSDLEVRAARLAKDVAKAERDMMAAGKPAGEIAAELKRRFGIDVAADDIARGMVWWRLGEEKMRRGVDSSHMHGEIRKLFADGLSDKAIAETLSRKHGVQVTAKAVENARNRHLGLSRQRHPGLGHDVEHQVADIYRGGASIRDTQRIMKEKHGVAIGSRRVEQIVAASGDLRTKGEAANRLDARLIDEMRAGDLAGMSARQIAERLSDMTGDTFTKDAVTSQLGRMRRAEAAEAERTRHLGDLADACKK